MSTNNEPGKCPYCLGIIDDYAERVRCPSCGSSHHRECWRANGKCAVYGCDGAVLWDESIADKIAPKVGATLELSQSNPPAQAEKAVPRCVSCGEIADDRHLLCWNCRVKQRTSTLTNILFYGLVIAGGVFFLWKFLG